MQMRGSAWESGYTLILCLRMCVLNGGLLRTVRRPEAARDMSCSLLMAYEGRLASELVSTWRQEIYPRQSFEFPFK